MAGKAKRALPAELEGIAYAEDLNAIQEKVDKCYSSERYEEFQGAVEKIVWKYLKANVASAILLWLVSIVGSMFLEKFIHPF